MPPPIKTKPAPKTAQSNTDAAPLYNPAKYDAVNKLSESLMKRFGEGAVYLANDNRHADIESFSTGSIGVDQVIGVGGIPRGRITEIFGPESSGKTTLCLSVIAAAQARGELCAFIDMEHALDMSWVKRLGVNPQALWISQPDTGEDALAIAEEFVRTGSVGVVVIDSVAALVPRVELEGEMGDAHVGLQARMMAQVLRRINGSVKQTKTVVIFTNQLRDKIGGFGFGPSETTAGGRALKFWSSVRIDIRRIQQIKAKDTTVGNRTKVKIVKNKVAAPYGECEFDIMFNEGISVIGEIIDLGVEHEIIKKSGAFFKYNDSNLAQGRDNLRAYFMNNPNVTFEIHNKVLAALGLPKLENVPIYNRLQVSAHADQDPPRSVDLTTGEIVTTSVPVDDGLEAVAAAYSEEA